MGEVQAKKANRKFNAVDLITCVVFAALVRVLFLVFKMFGVVFPFNHSVMQMFSAFCFVACVAVVKKPWAGFYYTIGWVAIDFFLQGEHYLYWVYAIIAPTIVELLMKARGKHFENPNDVYHSTKDMILFAWIYNTLYYWFTFWMILKIFLIPCPTVLMIAAYAIGIVMTILGAWLGMKVGKKANKLTN
ncbi:MAG: MptD family putative ECF transporter S component [Oscillibacter sp.]|jgi:hypothetical protein|nr:MptD family putative ECF transporter S component [Oscillibacter sp.]